jgi:hypothetical protein
MMTQAYPLLCYIDPGSGSLLFQAVIAGALAVSVGFKQARTWLWARVRLMFGRKPGPVAEAAREQGDA